MQIKIDFTKTAQENADDYYKKSKKLQQKKDGAEKAIKELKTRLEKAKKDEKAEAPPEKKTMIKQEGKEWYEKFRWFFTSNGMLAIGGKDAHQNEAVNSKYFEQNDLFFHANIFGASPVVLKGGRDSERDIREEVAQFAASHSSAWKENQRTVDVYAMKREQVSKSTESGSLGTGSFLLKGERDWYRDVVLALVMFVKDGKLNTVPLSTYVKIKDESIKKHVNVAQGRDKKSDAAKKIAKLLAHDDIDSIMQQLPAGEFKIS